MLYVEYNEPVIAAILELYNDSINEYLLSTNLLHFFRPLLCWKIKRHKHSSEQLQMQTYFITRNVPCDQYITQKDEHSGMSETYLFT